MESVRLPSIEPSERAHPPRTFTGRADDVQRMQEEVKQNQSANSKENETARKPVEIQRMERELQVREEVVGKDADIARREAELTERVRIQEELRQWMERVLKERERKLQERSDILARKEVNIVLREAELTRRANDIDQTQEEVRQTMTSLKSKEDEATKKQVELQKMERELQEHEGLLARKGVDLELKMEILKREQARLEDKRLKRDESALRPSGIDVEFRRDTEAAQAISSASRIAPASTRLGKDRKGLFGASQLMSKAADLVEQMACRHLLKDTLLGRPLLSVCRFNYRAYSINILQNHTSPRLITVDVPPS
jgi:hypothetical protein